MHKMTRATAIPKAVKESVYRRDHGLCVICGNPGLPNAHVVRRSRGGMGIEQNIVTLCPRCHREFDEGQNRSAYEDRILCYLKAHYPDWNREDLIYKKQGGTYGKTVSDPQDGG